MATQDSAAHQVSQGLELRAFLVLAALDNQDFQASVDCLDFQVCLASQANQDSRAFLVIQGPAFQDFLVLAHLDLADFQDFQAPQGFQASLASRAFLGFRAFQASAGFRVCQATAAFLEFLVFRAQGHQDFLATVVFQVFLDFLGSVDFLGLAGTQV